MAGFTGPEDTSRLKKQFDHSKKQYEQEKYQKIAQKHVPKASIFRNSLNAFLMGGLICAVAQALFNLISSAGFTVKEANTIVAVIMIFLGAFLTGIGIYDSIAKVGGAGAMVPITGFANSIVAPAMEFKKEGYIFGIGARMFSTAGPVLVYGIVTSIIVGLIAFTIM
ncbi:MAG TPA: stage V sporulation protein AC [Peptococcaceae bacterium]|nr:MAG: SpoVA protein [Clostridia bacterium 41_269]HBT20477.1 stage V sporulation protein AC [Peptococcaceae bacterium]